MKLLIIEDNAILLEAIANTMAAEKYLCETAESFDAAQEKIYLYMYDVLIVDINLPGGSGLDIIRQLKEKDPSAGIIVVSARNSTTHKIEGLDIGADDYITKPFDMAELVARVKSLMRRRFFAGSQTLTAGYISVDSLTREVRVNSRKVELTRSEYDILLFFMSNQGRVISRESLAEHIWGDNMDLADSFDFIYSHIKNLRKKITLAGSNSPIRAVYGVGYKFEIL